MLKLEDLKRQKELQAKKRYVPLEKDPNKQPICPIDYLKDKDFRRTVTASFNSTTKEVWKAARMPKTSAPDVGYYNPSFNQLEPHKKVAAIAELRESEGSMRINEREE